jgi:hypothetical protein
VAGAAANTTAGIELVEKLSSLKALDLLDKQLLPKLWALLKETIGFEWELGIARQDRDAEDLVFRRRSRTGDDLPARLRRRRDAERVRSTHGNYCPTDRPYGENRSGPMAESRAACVLASIRSWE